MKNAPSRQTVEEQREWPTNPLLKSEAEGGMSYAIQRNRDPRGGGMRWVPGVPSWMRGVLAGLWVPWYMGWAGKRIFGAREEGPRAEEGPWREQGCPGTYGVTTSDKWGRWGRAVSRGDLILCWVSLGQPVPSLGLSFLIRTCS